MLVELLKKKNSPTIYYIVGLLLKNLHQHNKHFKPDLLIIIFFYSLRLQNPIDLKII